MLSGNLSVVRESYVSLVKVNVFAIIYQDTDVRYLEIHFNKLWFYFSDFCVLNILTRLVI